MNNYDVQAKGAATMSIGYACRTIGVTNSNLKSCILKNANHDNLVDLMNYNLKALETMIDYNIRSGIKLFRISSDVIPFGSNSINNIEWWILFKEQLYNIGKKIKDSGMRVSMHPGQYTVLNSIDEGVVQRAYKDLDYHAKFLDSLHVGTNHKIILHIGGVYGDKKQSIVRFMKNYKELNDPIKARLVIENDDKSYDIGDVLNIGKEIGIPVIFDVLHHAIHKNQHLEDDSYWINECFYTWKENDGVQKIHYSQQNPNKKKGSHSNSIKIQEFLSFYYGLGRTDIDIMLEVKDKNLSTIKCINCISTQKRVNSLEAEWGRYKYKVLEQSQEDYLNIRKLLVNKEQYLPVPFYLLIEHALEKDDSISNGVNAALHIWGYFKNVATKDEKDKFFTSIKAFECGRTSVKSIKNQLWKMAMKYEKKYILDSYYFE